MEKKTGFNRGALADLLIIMIALVVIKQSVLPYSQLYAGPVSTLSAMLLGTWLLRCRGLSWHALGFRRPENILKTIGLTALTFAAIVAAASLSQWLINHEPIQTSGRFSHVEGNLGAYIGMLVLVWTHGSFFEELLFRAFIINRAGAVLGGGLAADIGAVVFSAVFFGYRHYYYQGLNGALQTGIIGLALGLLYIWFGRNNILPLIFSHGIVNTIGQTRRFLGGGD